MSAPETTALQETPETAFLTDLAHHEVNALKLTREGA
jgi:hypothetical protein